MAGYTALGVLLAAAALTATAARAADDDHMYHGGEDGGLHFGAGNDTAAEKLKLLVFGDDFVDNGNLPSEQVGNGKISRQWRSPYGVSDSAHGRRPTGRFSDGLVQSDLVAKILGHSESPPAHALQARDDDGMGASGMNFAVGGSYVLEEVARGNVTLGDQVQQLRSMMDHGLVERGDLRDSVALIAVSGNDYANLDQKGFEEMYGRAIEEIAKVVTQLQDLGVGKVMVNTLPPFGCAPWLARSSDYKGCDDGGNVGPDKYNAALRERLGGADGVLLLDINTVLTELAAPRQGSTMAQQFAERLRPCCEASDGGDYYCGKDGHYSLCDNPDDHLYWDAINPTQAGWAVMQLLQGQITGFLGISNLKDL